MCRAISPVSRSNVVVGQYTASPDGKTPGYLVCSLSPLLLSNLSNSLIFSIIYSTNFNVDFNLGGSHCPQGLQDPHFRLCCLVCQQFPLAWYFYFFFVYIISSSKNHFRSAFHLEVWKGFE